VPPRIQMGTNAEIIEVLLISFRWMLTTEVAEGCQRTARNVVGGSPIESEHNRKGARTQPSWRSCLNCEALNVDFVGGTVRRTFRRRSRLRTYALATYRCWRAPVLHGPRIFGALISPHGLYKTPSGPRRPHGRRHRCAAPLRALLQAIRAMPTSSL